MRRSENSKSVRPLVALAFMSMVFAGLLARADAFVPGKIEVLEGPGGEKLTVIHAKPMDKNQALIRFENTGSDWDGKIIFHEVQEVGRGKYDYVAMAADGMPWRSLLVRTGLNGNSSMELWVKGIKDPIKVSFDKKDTETAMDKVQNLVNEYEKSVKK